jgi:phosphatidylinositol glycan class B
LSPWQWYVSTRTFSNSLETTLTVIALAYFPWSIFAKAPVETRDKTKTQEVAINLSSLRISLSLAALAVVLRPTNLFIWTPIALVALSRLSTGNILNLAREAVLCGSLVLGLSVLADRWFFGFWTFPPWLWLNFNVSKSLAVFYGRNPWHYYLLQGMPLLCTTSLPFTLQALWKPKGPGFDTTGHKLLTLRSFTWAIFIMIGILSLISHKEVRFIYPLLPTLNVLAAPYVASFFTRTTKPAAQKSPNFTMRNKPYLFAALSINFILAGYLSTLHQPAPLSVLHFLRNDFTRIHQPPNILTPVGTSSSADSSATDELFALFLMPCHSTPWRSHLISPSLHARALTCEPPLHTQPNTPERDLYRDEADRFYDAPLNFLTAELFSPSDPSSLKTLPRYIVGFEGIEPWLQEFADQTEVGKGLGLRLEKVWEGFNGFFNEDWRRAGKMVVWDTGRFRHGSLEKAF